MRKSQWSLVAALALALLAVGPLCAAPGEIEEIEVLGLQRMTREAFLHAFDIRPGDPYDVVQVRARFRALWDGSWFEDIRIEREDAPGGGVALIIHVKERPMIASLTFEELTSVTRTEIEDRLRDRDVRLRAGSPVDQGKIVDAEGVIRDLMAEKGFLDATVEAKIDRVTETSRAIHFDITPGGKTRIKKIQFTGNTVFKNKKLKGELQLTEERRWYWPWSGKNLYHPQKWDQDVTAVRKLYQDSGYLDVDIRPPVVEVRQNPKEDKKKAKRERSAERARIAAIEADVPIDASMKKKQRKKLLKKKRQADKKARKKSEKAKKVKRWVQLTVPLTEGIQYRMGKVEVTGAEKFEPANLRATVRVPEGAIFRNDLVDRAVDDITRAYEDSGHLYASVVRRIQRREGEPIADVEIVIDEDKPYYIARIEFSGNTATHDRVLRREVALLEGQRFSRTLLDISKIKINQLGYFSVEEEPVIEPIEGESRVNVKFDGVEQGRNEIQVGGGYSGLDGAFFNGVYSTRNFLGRGQVVSAAVQVGGRSSRYQLTFQEPWFFGRPWLVGGSVFRRDADFGSTFSTTSRGVGVIFGRRLGRASRINIGYNWEDLSSRQPIIDSLGQTTVFEATNEISSITPFYVFNTVNNPYRPSRGTQFNFSFQVAGGPLGGNTNFLRPVARFTHYGRAWGRNIFAVHAQGGVIREWRGGSGITPSNIEGVPRAQRFWLGGDTQGPRIFETRSITPRRYWIIDPATNNILGAVADPTGSPLSDFFTSGGVPLLIESGGDRYYLFQTELIFPLGEQAEVALFFDVGDALFEDQSFTFETSRMSSGLEVRFHLPVFPVPLRLIYGFPVRKLESDRTSSFTFAIGRSF
ncbi:MAG: outer membrane protein assembly factor BamA [Acidobacteria bacterium]|nr:outer membrane protein assembly factor BamA [Acidobacteriota bacterium]NIM64247.1 outer membrane protein assembly factor BamA [Acidobacteriota bacterium]NIO59245.1 outer membrane protein assembly factor BamA [Acidobacteriota bacterium]NIQ30272.1 outer membrane protein assembly factor BamA [Acidobacteriota bacterium]NIQ85200.1 outer membrane protein assembly factor BamA [Acidobacteriota bacterium]